MPLYARVIRGEDRAKLAFWQRENEPCGMDNERCMRDRKARVNVLGNQGGKNIKAPFLVATIHLIPQ